MKLGFDLTFINLNNMWGLNSVDDKFLEFLRDAEPALLDNLLKMRACADTVSDKEYSTFICDLSPYVDDFLSILFDIEQDIAQVRKVAAEFDIIYECKRKFVQRFALKKYSCEQVLALDFEQISRSLQQLLEGPITQDNFAKKTIEWLQNINFYECELEVAAQYASCMVYSGSKNILFNLPQNLDKQNLITQKKIKQHESDVRYGFDYHAPELNSSNALNNAHYCIYCHNQGKDSCSKGLVNAPETNVIPKNGCPLRQKISEMNYVKARGFNLAALAIIVIDNPLAAATGHRICNDCMNSCIFQKQDPVNIPLVESEILNQVISLNYGVEIYLLLTKWNPLNIHSPLPKSFTGYNVLVTGLGPAGFSLSHYMLNEGHNVVAIDGLKITQMPFDVGAPIKNWQDHQQKLSARIPQGFGGVAEYGITARWDKNNLTLLRLILERRDNFKIYSGVRLDSNITADQAFKLGFDHIAMCVGAGEPKIPVIENFLAKGVRTASDFLMTLQNGGAYLKDSATNLTLRLPVVIIGCGLTAVDSAVEAINYYPVQVEKFYKNYENLVQEHGSEFVEQQWSAEDKIIAREFITHAKMFRGLTQTEIRSIVTKELGGISVCYRGNLQDSQGYKLNPEEIIHAIAAGVKFIENASPVKINVDEYGYAASVDFGMRIVHAKTIIMAIGTEASGGELKDARFSYFGDCNPDYAGSVVKALASSKDGYKNITKNLSARSPSFSGSYKQFIAKLNYLLISTINRVNILSDNIVELIVHSPMAVKNFKPGQFFRLQNYSNNPQGLMEPLALTGAYVDTENHLISLIILELGKSSLLCRDLRPGDKIVLMGPTGEPTQILKGLNIVLVGGGLGNAVLFSIGRALTENGCTVTYIAGYKKAADRFYAEKIESSASTVIWCCEEELLLASRPQDISIKGNVIDGIKQIDACVMQDRFICIGSSSMMEAVKNAKAIYFPHAELVCSLNSPMQCMMKGICGQCVQKVEDARKYIFSCVCQDQDADIVDFQNLKDRLAQNSLQEKLARYL
jgi:NADPH-dependent glutamate synthase beta subunit-like oxidoreductase/NAD(P)H-flavin reductase